MGACQVWTLCESHSSCLGKLGQLELELELGSWLDGREGHCSISFSAATVSQARGKLPRTGNVSHPTTNWQHSPPLRRQGSPELPGPVREGAAAARSAATSRLGDPWGDPWDRQSAFPFPKLVSSLRRRSAPPTAEQPFPGHVVHVSPRQSQPLSQPNCCRSTAPDPEIASRAPPRITPYEDQALKPGQDRDGNAGARGSPGGINGDF